MRKKDGVVLEDNDMATFLSGLASDLRRDGLALTGLAYESHRPGDEEFRTLTDMTGGLDRMALMLDKAGASLCESCRTKQVVERVILGKGETASGKAGKSVRKRRRG